MSEDASDVVMQCLQGIKNMLMLGAVAADDTKANGPLNNSSSSSGPSISGPHSSGTGTDSLIDPSTRHSVHQLLVALQRPHYHHSRYGLLLDQTDINHCVDDILSLYFAAALTKTTNTINSYRYYHH
jgi:hypothetical protein